ncbi:intraflagellar transport protein 20 [Holotrichia oblita]|uniref:Intraflagellar transport protein 20 n=2 Tax=Holotrichia oblita TaxID=644536 RepID=A0ACB9T296_HOLOL|nr:intraflagellar transport protein 20 [Holotrichia oblita]KAI4460927.1 intraflagellar transport protein 20 [Holotrichia oblita]
MSDALTKSGIFFDEVDKVRILEPVASKQTNDLKDECKIYIEKINEFQKISSNFIAIADKLAQEVEKQKIKAIGARNILQTMEKQKDVNHQQLQALISEKMMQLERLKILYNSLQKTEMEQNEIINRLTHY